MTHHSIQAIETELRAVLGRELKQDLTTTDAEAPLAQALGIDSLRALELLAVVEEHFGIEFEDADLARDHSLARIRDAIAESQET